MMTYAKTKAATPAKAATIIDPCTLDAPLADSMPEGEAGAVGAVTLWGMEIVPVEPPLMVPAGVLVGLGVTVMVL